MLNIISFLIMPLLLLGLINKTKAFWAGKQGSPVLQSYLDFIKLLKKGLIINQNTSFLYNLAPTVSLGAVFFAGLFVPGIAGYSVLNFNGNFILFCYILGLSRFFMVLAAFDAGSSFEGMGANREIIFSLIVEPALFILFGSLVLLNPEHLNFSSLLSGVSESAIFIILAVIIVFIAELTEACRVPVDDPKTHLELTMIHEVMVLDYSGIDLGIIHFISGLKIFIYNSIIINIILPAESISTTIFILMQLILSVFIASLESCVSRFRMSLVPQFILLSTSFAMLLFILILFR